MPFFVQLLLFLSQLTSYLQILYPLFSRKREFLNHLSCRDNSYKRSDESRLQGYKIKHSVFDSAYDNYHFYRLLIGYYKISPIIEINNRCEGKFQNKNLMFFTQDETPICLYGLTLANWGFCWDRGRNKWRCPVCSLAQYKDEECPYRDICQKKRSNYGRVVYTRPEENFRYFTPVPRDSDFWKELYNKRSASERSFKSKKRDYKLSITRTRGRKMWTIRVALACMCKHIDAQAQIFGFAKSERLNEELIPA